VDDRLQRVALTGGIATGKSYCLRHFQRAGVATIDADLLAREAVAPGSAGLAAVVARFGAGALDADGTLDRAALGRLVFADAAARADLERIIHPAVFARIAAWFGELARAGEPMGIADVPLLYETGRERDFDRVIVAACAPEQQQERLQQRDGLSAQEALGRIAAQVPIDEKRARADFVIDTGGTPADTDRQLEAVLRRLRE
jgi:dephospho-CoA kinase